MLDAATDKPNLPEVTDSDYPENAQSIMEAGLEKFARKGYAATSVREIVRAADVTNPMLYYYFDSKEGLFIALIDYLFKSITDKITAAIDESGSFEEALEEIIWVHMEGCLDNPTALQFVYFVLFGPPKSKPEFDVMEAREAMIAKSAELLMQAQSSGEFELPDTYDLQTALERFFGLVNQELMGALKQSDYADSPEEALEAMRARLNRQACRELKDFYLRGLGVR